MVLSRLSSDGFEIVVPTTFDLNTTPKSKIVAAIDRLRLSNEVVVVQRHNDGTITAQPITTKAAPTTTLVGLAQFDTKLTDIVSDIKQERRMSNITGAGFLGNQFKTALADVKNKLNKAGSDMNAAVTELNAKADQASTIVKQIEAETADLTATLGQITNGAPE
jgi:hypothetical protein